MEKHSVGQTIAALRKKKGWTQVELAEKLQVSDKAVSKWEKDDAFPSVEFFPVLASLFGVSIDFLMTGKAPEKEVILMSKMELCAKNDDVSLLDGISSKSKDENGKTLADYVLQYESVNVYNACKQLRFSHIDDIKMALIANNIDRLDSLKVKKLAHEAERNSVPQHLRTSIPIITDGILHLIVDDPRVLESTFDYLIAPLNEEPKYKKSSKNVWYWVIPHLIHMCYETGNSKKLEKLLKVAMETNEWASQQHKGDSVYRHREVNLGSEYSEDIFGIIIIAKRTFELALNNGDIELVETFNKINTIPLPIISQSRHVANADEIRVAKLRKDGNIGADELSVQSALHSGVLCIDEILATKDYKLIKNALETYPICQFELKYIKIQNAKQMLSDRNWRDLFKFAVDSGWSALITSVLERNVEQCEKILERMCENLTGHSREMPIPHSGYYKGENSQYLYLRNSHTTQLRVNCSYKLVLEYINNCKRQILEDCKNLYDKESKISELTKEYFESELEKGNTEIVIIKLCVRLEAILRCDYHYEGEFSEMLNEYCSKHGREDDGWGYDIEANFVKYLHKLRKCRNNIVHSERTEEAMTIDEIKFCIEYICRMG